jgi:hypothetical protein
MPFGDELLQRLRSRVGVQDFEILERDGPFDAISGIRAALISPALVEPERRVRPGA